MIRLFIALFIPEEVRSEIDRLREEISANDNNFKWEDFSKIHLTLKFIGEVEESILTRIEKELNFLETYKKIKCSFEKFGFFFKQKDEPRILWLGLKVDKHVSDIVDELNKRLEKFSIPTENRKFKAHLTLLRIKNKVSKGFIDKFSKAFVPQINFTANEIVLMQSKLSSAGSFYTEIKKYLLK